jgi:hypothetical protein
MRFFVFRHVETASEVNSCRVGRGGSVASLCCVSDGALLLLYFVSRGSSVSIVSDYGLDDRAIEVRSPAGAKDFSSNLCVQTGSGAHPASCTIGTGGSLPGEKRGRGVTLTSHPHLVPRSGMSRSYTPAPHAPSWRVAGLLCFALLLLRPVVSVPRPPGHFRSVNQAPLLLFDNSECISRNRTAQTRSVCRH